MAQVHGLNASFWELHKKLGECYQADLQMASVHSHGHGRVLSDQHLGMARQVSSASQHSHDVRPEHYAGFKPEPPMFPPKVLSGQMSVSARSSAERPEISASQRRMLERDMEAEEKAIRKMNSTGGGTASKSKSPNAVEKSARFNEAADIQMQVPSSSSESLEAPPKVNGSSPRDGQSPKSVRRDRTEDLDDFQPRACWNLDLISQSFMRRKSNITWTSRSGVSMGSQESMQEIRDAVQAKMHQHDFFVIHPHATFKIVWDLLGMLFLLRDLFFIPLQLFEIPAAYVIQWLDTTSLIFWTLDILLSFFTGYYEKGRLELHHRRIALNYVKTWFPLDVVVVGIDWWFQTQQTNGAEGVARVTKSIRSARFLRMFRLIRLSKMSKVSILLREQISSEAGMIYFGILLVILRMFMLQHIIACGWFGIGDLAEGEEGKSWLLTHSFRERTFNYQYTTCLHWAFAQLGIGSVEIDPETTQERVYCIMVAFVGLISFSTLVSTVTSLMSNLQKAQDQEQQLFRDLRHFLHQNDIPIDLSQRVTRFLQHAYRAQTSRSVDSEVAIFGLLSKSLKAELQFTRYKHCLFNLALCKKILTSDPDNAAETVAQSLAVKSITTLQLAQNDVIFSRGTVARTCFFALEDNLEYIIDKSKFTVPQGTPIAEMSLWTPWVYVGALVSREMSRVVAMDVEAFCSTIAEMHDVKEQAIYLAQHILEALNNEQDVNELWQYHVEDASQLGRDASEIRINPLRPMVYFWQRWINFGKSSKEVTSVVPN